MYVEKYHVQKSILWPIFGCKNQVKFPTLGSLIYCSHFFGTNAVLDIWSMKKSVKFYDVSDANLWGTLRQTKQ